MAKELTHRASELQTLGWSNEEVSRYAELWDYRQRWGAMNLERDDRLFLKKAEAALPKIVTGKTSIKKPIKEKSYYRWLLFYLELMNEAETKNNGSKGSKGIWPIFIEEELKLIDYYQPVLGLPDTIKSKNLIPFRENITKEALITHKDKLDNIKFDFETPIDIIKKESKSSWRYFREGVPKNEQTYPLLSSDIVELFRKELRIQFIPKFLESFPSLSDTDKPLPSDF